MAAVEARARPLLGDGTEGAVIDEFEEDEVAAEGMFNLTPSEEERAAAAAKTGLGIFLGEAAEAVEVDTGEVIV